MGKECPFRQNLSGRSLPFAVLLSALDSCDRKPCCTGRPARGKTAIKSSCIAALRCAPVGSDWPMPTLCAVNPGFRSPPSHPALQYAPKLGRAHQGD